MQVLRWRLNAKPETRNAKPEIDNPASTTNMRLNCAVTQAT